MGIQDGSKKDKQNERGNVMIISKKTIEAIRSFDRKQKAEQKLNEAKEDLKKKLIDKLNFLRGIGWHVLDKMTDYRFDRAELIKDSTVGWIFKWTNFDFDSLNMTTTGFSFKTKAPKKENVETIEFNYNILQFSDRDFAKFLRLVIHKVKTGNKIKEGSENLTKLENKKNELMSLQKEIRMMESLGLEEALKTNNMKLDEIVESIIQRKKMMGEENWRGLQGSIS